MLAAIIYLSEQTIPFNETTLKKLSEKSHHNNSLVDVTGFLSFKNGIFYQYLEGDLNEVKKIVKVIETDSRHKVLYKFNFSTLKKRIFNKWGMKYYAYNKENYFDHDNLVRDILEVISENAGFESKFEAELIENLKYIRKNLHKHLPHLE